MLWSPILHRRGCPIRRSTDIALIYSSPWLIAVSRVLRRLLMPRHSPYALLCLNFFLFSYLLLWVSQIIFFTMKKLLSLLSFDLPPFLTANCSFLPDFIQKNLFKICLKNYLFVSISLFGFQWSLHFVDLFSIYLVGSSGLEPPTSCLSGTRSNLLSYEPI